MFPLNLYARVRFFAQFCTRDRGCSAHPVFPAPSFGRRSINNPGASRRGNTRPRQVPEIAEIVPCRLIVASR